MNNPIELIYVTTVYNEKLRVNKYDLENPNKILIPIYNRNGIKIYDSKSYNWKHDSGKEMLHKGNIKC